MNDGLYLAPPKEVPSALSSQINLVMFNVRRAASKRPPVDRNHLVSAVEAAHDKAAKPTTGASHENGATMGLGLLVVMCVHERLPRAQPSESVASALAGLASPSASSLVASGLGPASRISVSKISPAATVNRFSPAIASSRRGSMYSQLATN